MSSLNKEETATLLRAVNVMDNVAKSIRTGKATANHAELLEMYSKQVNAVVTMKGNYE